MRVPCFVALVVLFLESLTLAVGAAEPAAPPASAQDGGTPLTCDSAVTQLDSVRGQQVAWVGRAISWETTHNEQGELESRVIYVVTDHGEIHAPVCSFVTDDGTTTKDEAVVKAQSDRQDRGDRLVSGTIRGETTVTERMGDSVTTKSVPFLVDVRLTIPAAE